MFSININNNNNKPTSTSLVDSPASSAMASAMEKSGTAESNNTQATTKKPQPNMEEDALAILLAQIDNVKSASKPSDDDDEDLNDWVTRVAQEIFSRRGDSKDVRGVNAGSIVNEGGNYIANNPREQAIVEVLTRAVESSSTSWAEGYNEERIYQIHAVFERLLGGSHHDLDAAANLKAISSHIVDLRCREIWEGTHSAYRCITCGLSNASCLCIFCFDPELHVGHDYKMYTSNAGGCCDCGDAMAWNPAGFCKKHKKALEEKNKMEKVRLPEIILFGVRIVANCLIQQIRWALRRCFWRGNLKQPDESGYYGLLRAVQFLSDKMCSFHPEFNAIVAEAMIASNNAGVLMNDFFSWPAWCGLYVKGDVVGDLTCLKSLLRLGITYLPSPIQEAISVLFLHLLLHPPFKRQFFLDFIDHYPVLLNLYVASWEKREEEMEEQSQVTLLYVGTPIELSHPLPQRVDPIELSGELIVFQVEEFLNKILCQLFYNADTVMDALTNHPTLLPYMIETVEKLLLIQPAEDFLTHEFIKREVYRRPFQDCSIIFDHPSAAAYIVRENTFAWTSMLRIFAHIQLMDCQVRRLASEEHVLFPSDSYRYAFSFVIDVYSLFNPLIEATIGGLKTKQAWAEKLLLETCLKVKHWMELPESSSYILGGDESSSTPERYSFHLPLIRLFTRLICEANFESFPFLNRIPDFPDIVLKMSQFSIKTFAFMGQINEGLWKRNGPEMLSQIQLHLMKYWSFHNGIDLDVAIIQIAMVVCGVNPMIEEIFNRMSFSSAEAFRLIGTVARDPTWIDFSTENTVRRTILHVLAAAPSNGKSFSELNDSLYNVKLSGGGGNEIIQTIIREYADFENGKNLHTTGMFTLKKAFYESQVDFYYYSRYGGGASQERAIHNWRRSKGISDEAEMPGIFKQEFKNPLFADLSKNVLCAWNLRSRVLGVLVAQDVPISLVFDALGLLLQEFLYYYQSTSDEFVLLGTLQSKLASDKNDALKGRILQILKVATTTSTTTTTTTTAIHEENKEDVTTTEMSSSPSTRPKNNHQDRLMKKFAKKQRHFLEGLENLHNEDAEEMASTSAAVTVEENASLLMRQQDEPKKDDDEVSFNDLDGKKHEHDLTCCFCSEGEMEGLALCLLGNSHVSMDVNTLDESHCYLGGGQWVAKVSEIRKGRDEDSDIASHFHDYPHSAVFNTHRCIEEIRFRWFRDHSSTTETQNPTTDEMFRNVVFHSCGHVMHSHCAANYLLGIAQRASNGDRFEGESFLDLSAREFLCPKCRRLVNALLPFHVDSFRTLDNRCEGFIHKIGPPPPQTVANHLQSWKDDWAWRRLSYSLSGFLVVKFSGEEKSPSVKQMEVGFSHHVLADLNDMDDRLGVARGVWFSMNRDVFEEFLDWGSGSSSAFLLFDAFFGKEFQLTEKHQIHPEKQIGICFDFKQSSGIMLGERFGGQLSFPLFLPTDWFAEFHFASQVYDFLARFYGCESRDFKLFEVLLGDDENVSEEKLLINSLTEGCHFESKQITTIVLEWEAQSLRESFGFELGKFPAVREAYETMKANDPRKLKSPAFGRAWHNFFRGRNNLVSPMEEKRIANQLASVEMYLENILGFDMSECELEVRTLVVPIPSLMNAYFENCHEMSFTGEWEKFVQYQVIGCLKKSKTPQTLLSANLTEILIKWIALDPGFLSNVSKSMDVKDALDVVRFLLPFALLQDLLLDCLPKHFENETVSGFSDLNFAGDDVANIYRRAALEEALRQEKAMSHRTRMDKKARLEMFGRIARFLGGGGDEEAAKEGFPDILKSFVPKQDGCLESKHRKKSNTLSFVRQAILFIQIIFNVQFPSPHGNDGAGGGGGGDEDEKNAGLFQVLGFSKEVKSIQEWRNHYEQQQQQQGAFVIKLLTKTLHAFMTSLIDLITPSELALNGVEAVSVRLSATALLPACHSGSMFLGSDFRPFSLIELPKQYTTLLTCYVGRKAVCSVCGTSPTEPALCLCCGVILCVSSGRASCCTAILGRDEVTWHVAGHCVRALSTLCAVLYLKSSVVVLYSRTRVSVISNLYVDRFGEEDINLRRGYPLSLNVEIYKAMDRFITLSSFMNEGYILDRTRSVVPSTTQVEQTAPLVGGLEEETAAAAVAVEEEEEDFAFDEQEQEEAEEEAAEEEEEEREEGQNNNVD